MEGIPLGKSLEVLALDGAFAKAARYCYLEGGHFLYAFHRECFFVGRFEVIRMGLLKRECWSG